MTKKSSRRKIAAAAKAISDQQRVHGGKLLKAVAQLADPSGKDDQSVLEGAELAVAVLEAGLAWIDREIGVAAHSAGGRSSGVSRQDTNSDRDRWILERIAELEKAGKGPDAAGIIERELHNRFVREGLDPKKAIKAPRIRQISKKVKTN